HDEADARVQLTGVPLDFRDHATRLAPALCLIAEARIEAPDVMRRPSHGPREQGRDARLEYLIGRETNGVLEALRFQVLVHVRQGEGRIATQYPPDGLAAIPRDDRVEHLAPAVGAVHVTRPERTPF